MAWFLWDDCNIAVSISSIWRALKRNRWSRKIVQRRAMERSEDLRAAWKGRQCTWDSNRLIFIDESGANERTGYRKFGWSYINLPAIDTISIKRSERWSILPAYSFNGFLPGTLIWQGSITSEIFNAWIKSSILPQCIPGYTVLVLDNASIHKSPVRK